MLALSIPAWAQNIHRTACNGDIAQIDSLLKTVNTSIIEFALKLSSDVKYLFFNRGVNIFWVDAKIIEDLKNNEYE